MDNKKDIAAIFNKFAGREVIVQETPMRPAHERHKDGAYAVNVSLDPFKEPTLMAMTKAAAENKLDLCVNFGGDRVRITSGKNTTGYGDCVNTYVEHAPDGKYRIGSRFDIG